MRVRTLVTAVAGALLVPGIASAEFAYTGIEASYVDVDLDSGPFNVDGDGYRFGGTYEIADSFFLLGEWEEQNFDFGIDGRTLEIGGGYFHSLDSDLDFIATASYVDSEVEAGGLRIDDNGIALGAGIRARLADSFQVEAVLDWVDYDNSGSNTGIRLSGRYYLSDRFAVGVETDFDDDVDTLRLGIRAEF